MSSIGLVWRSLVRRRSRSILLLAMMALLTATIVCLVGVSSSLASFKPGKSGVQIDHATEEISQEIIQQGEKSTQALQELVGATASSLNLLFEIIAISALAALILVEILWIRGRRQEIGVLLSLGKSKAWISALVGVETALLAGCALIIGHIAVRIMSIPLLNYLSTSLNVQLGEFWSAQTWLSHLLACACIAFALVIALAPFLAAPPRKILASIE